MGDVMAVLEIRHFEMVRAICECGTVAAAAERLHVSRPALSHALGSLERRLGVSLFERGQRMVPTAGGMAVRDAAGEILAQATRAEEEARRRVAAHTVRVATECYTSYWWLHGVARAFRARQPGVALQVVPGAAGRTAAALLDGTLDLAVLQSRPRTALLTSELLFDDELLLVVSPEHRLAARRSGVVSPEDVSRETLLCHDALEQSSIWRSFLAPAGVRPADVFVPAMTDVVVESIRAGVGVAALARWVVERPLSSGELVGLRLGRRGVRRTWYAATLRTTAKPATAALLSLLRSEARQLVRGTQPAKARRGVAART